MPKEVKYINIKCTTPERKRVHAKLEKMASDKGGMDVTALVVMLLNDATKDYDAWYNNYHLSCLSELIEKGGKPE